MPTISVRNPFRATVLCIFICTNTSVALINRQFDTSKTPAFDWSALKSSPDLIWHECYSPLATQESPQQILSPPSKSTSHGPRKFSCARLTLPLNYHNTSNHHNISILILKVSSQSPSNLGTIITSFGGAGNSRINDLVNFATHTPLLDILDPEYEYDFLTFDNRGFGYSVPSARCFESILDGVLWEERMNDLSGVMSYFEGENLDSKLGVRISAARAKSELCERKSEDVDIRSHMTTAYAARDMLEILKRLSRASDEARSSAIPKLNFLGLSYGTILGQTFASLYPEHVSRMVLDGVVGGDDWVGKWQMQHLIDTDAVWASFFNDCFTAKETCPLWRSSDSSVKEIEDRVRDFVEKLKERPVYTVSDGNARLITYRDVKVAIYWTTMALEFASSSMAASLNGLMNGDTNVTLEFPFENILSVSDYLHKETQEARADSNADAGTALNCGDAEDLTSISISEFKHYLEVLGEQSSVAAFYQAERKIRCLGWNIRSAWRFIGPFTSRRDNGGNDSKLETPILLLSNKLDPMTSVENARKVVGEFPGSVLLERDRRGHCALAGVAPSSCLLGYVRDYFRWGSLPEIGTMCGKDCNVFDGSCLRDGDEY